VGIGFWITQVVLAVVAIITGISAERHNRAEQNTPSADSAYERVPVESAGSRRDAIPFTAGEQSRLLVLRRLVERARALKTDLYDDLTPDRSAEVGPSASSYTYGNSLPWKRIVVCTGVVLVGIGCIGTWHANAAMARIERQARGTMITGSIANHLLPGVVAYPGKYLAAVNSSSSGLSGDRDPLQVIAWLDQKQAVDRFEGIIGLGAACLLAVSAGWPRGGSQTGLLGEEPRGSVGSDVLPFLLVASVFVMAMSFFELP
jgi:hypothetical protein